MPLCVKCHQNEATVHFVTVVGGAQDGSVHLCRGCAPPELGELDLENVEALSVIGKKCEFCGRDASSGEMGARGGAIYWCFGCGLEFGRILANLLRCERPDFMQQSQGEIPFLSFCCDPELQAWSEAAKQKVAQVLKERRP